MSQDNSKAKELSQTKDQVDAVRFLTACQAGDMDTIKKMIFEENLEYTKALQAYFVFANTDDINEVKRLFEQRELNKNLSNSLPTNDTIDKKPKI